MELPKLHHAMQGLVLTTRLWRLGHKGAGVQLSSGSYSCTLEHLHLHMEYRHVHIGAQAACNHRSGLTSDVGRKG